MIWKVMHNEFLGKGDIFFFKSWNELKGNGYWTEWRQFMYSWQPVIWRLEDTKKKSCELLYSESELNEFKNGSYMAQK